MTVTFTRETKRSELFTGEENETSSFTSPAPVSNMSLNNTYAQTFLDTAVLVKHFPVTAKKQNSETDLGVTPLQGITQAVYRDPIQTTKMSLPKVTSTVSILPSTTTLACWK